VVVLSDGRKKRKEGMLMFIDTSRFRFYNLSKSEIKTIRAAFDIILRNEVVAGDEIDKIFMNIRKQSKKVL